MTTAVRETHLEGLSLVRRGKVRDVYALDDERLLLVATDRVSAFDAVMAEPIPWKGAVLTQLSAWWMQTMPEAVPHQLISDRPELELEELEPYREQLALRTLLVRRTTPILVECVVRGYLAGSVHREYQQHGTVRGVPVEEGLQLASPLPEPIFTPAIKMMDGHDEDVPFARVVEELGAELAHQLKERSLAIYQAGRERAAGCGMLLADTKFEFGQTPDGQLLLIDEALTPDSSRFWPAEQHQPGQRPASLDKQILRDFLAERGYRGDGAPPALPESLVQQLTARYLELYRRLVGAPLDG